MFIKLKVIKYLPEVKQQPLQFPALGRGLQKNLSIIVNCNQKFESRNEKEKFD
jgi:hypothetical protein